MIIIMNSMKLETEMEAIEEKKWKLLARADDRPSSTQHENTEQVNSIQPSKCNIQSIFSLFALSFTVWLLFCFHNHDPESEHIGFVPIVQTIWQAIDM